MVHHTTRFRNTTYSKFTWSSGKLLFCGPQRIGNRGMVSPNLGGLLLQNPYHLLAVLVHPSSQDIQVLNIGQQECPGLYRQLRRRIDPSQQLFIVHHEPHGVKAQDAVLNPSNVKMPSPRCLIQKSIISELIRDGIVTVGGVDLLPRRNVYSGVNLKLFEEIWFHESVVPSADTMILQVVVCKHGSLGMPQLADGPILVHPHSSIHPNQGGVGAEGILHGVSMTPVFPPLQVPCVIVRDKIRSHDFIEQVQSFPGQALGIPMSCWSNSLTTTTT